MSNSLWYKVIKSKYGLNSNLWDATLAERETFRSPWKVISSLYIEFSPHVSFKVVNGLKIRFWKTFGLVRRTCQLSVCYIDHPLLGIHLSLSLLKLLDGLLDIQLRGTFTSDKIWMIEKHTSRWTFGMVGTGEASS